MAQSFKSGIIVCALGAAVALPTPALAGNCTGPMTEISPSGWPGASICTDSETGAIGQASISERAGDDPGGIFMLARDVEGLSDWHLEGFTFDADGNVLEGCFLTLDAPTRARATNGGQTGEVCQPAVYIQLEAEFTP